MTNFENFYQDLLDLAKKHELQNTPLKIEKDLENILSKFLVKELLHWQGLKMDLMM